MEAARDDVLAFLHFPQEHWRKIWSQRGEVNQGCSYLQLPSRSKQLKRKARTDDNRGV